jgi:hypothetical protein
MPTLKELRLRARLSAEELRRLANVTGKTVNRAEQGLPVQFSGQEVVYCLLTYSKRKATSWNKDHFPLSTADFFASRCYL